MATAGGDTGHMLVPPPEHEIEILYRLAQIGDMRDIVRYAAHLSELDARYHPFAHRLAALAENDKSKAILSLGEGYRETPYAQGNN